MSDVVLEAWQGPMPTRHGRRRSGVLKATSFCAVLAGMLALSLFVVRSLPSLTPFAPAASPAPAPWRDILKPVKIYSLQAAAFAGAPATYTARAHSQGGGREDVLTFGQFDGDKPALRLRIFRRSSETAGTTTLKENIASEAADLGFATADLGRPNALPTRLGRFDVADVTLRRVGGRERSCAGFRLALDQPALSITGLACNRRAATLSLVDVGCLLERLDVASARDDRELIDFFAASELRRNSACAGMRLGPDGLHAPWLDEKPTPPPAANKVPSGRTATSHRSLRRH